MNKQILIDTNYDFLVNDADEIMLVMNSYEGKPENAKLLFDGQRTALLIRNAHQTIKLDALPSDIIDNLKSVKTILVCEMTEEADFGETYNATVVGK